MRLLRVEFDTGGHMSEEKWLPKWNHGCQLNASIRMISGVKLISSKGRTSFSNLADMKCHHLFISSYRKLFVMR